MRIKGQTAMEYLMTYGWAILIVIIVVAALYMMGVFTVGPGVPYSGLGYFHYRDHNTTHLILLNGPKEIEVTTPSLPGIYNASDEITISLTGAGSLGCTANTWPCEFTITYKDRATGMSHDDTGKLFKPK